MSDYSERKSALKSFKQIVEDTSLVLVVHYSQLKLSDDEGMSPIISAIVVKSLDNNFEYHFAIHLEADKASIPLEEIEDSYRDLELRVLKAFNEFVRRHSHCIWVHWNMKNVHFGFEAIKHRFEKVFYGLRESYQEIPSNKKINLCKVLEGMYGENFVTGPDKLASLIKYNNDGVLNNNYLTLEREGHEFDNKNFGSILKSLDCKTDFLSKAVKLLNANDLEIENKNRYAIFVGAVYHPITTLIGILIGAVGLILTILSYYR